MRTKNNILFISRAYGENAGGMERLSLELISRFPDAARIVNETKHGSSLFSARLRSVVFVLTVIPRTLMQARNVDSIHIGDPVLLLVAACIKVIYRKQIFCTVHGLDVAYNNALYQAYLKLFLPYVDHFIAISDYAKDLLVQKNISQSITVIPPGVVDKNYDESISRKDLEKLLNKNIDHTVVFATTGRLITRKGHAWFIENIMPHVPENVLYIIAGSGPERDAIATIIKKNNLQGRVVMLGRISDKDQKIVLNTCDAFIQPNIAVANDHEGFGIAPLEAALCARKVFASNIDGIPSAIIHGKNGTLLPVEDANAWIGALTEYAAHPSIRLEAREYTKQVFNWDTIAKKYAEVFERGLSR